MIIVHMYSIEYCIIKLYINNSYYIYYIIKFMYRIIIIINIITYMISLNVKFLKLHYAINIYYYYIIVNNVIN